MCPWYATQPLERKTPYRNVERFKGPLELSQYGVERGGYGGNLFFIRRIKDQRVLYYRRWNDFGFRCKRKVAYMMRKHAQGRNQGTWAMH
jgi:hypothetical protein